MGYNSNFDVKAHIEGEHLNVTGTSGGEDKDLKILSRHFLVQQGKQILARQAQETEGNWGAVHPLPATGFETGSVVMVLGTETYYLERDEAPPMFVSMTWSQSVEIT